MIAMYPHCVSSTPFYNLVRGERGEERKEEGREKGREVGRGEGGGGRGVGYIFASQILKKIKFYFNCVDTKSTR